MRPWASMAHWASTRRKGDTVSAAMLSWQVTQAPPFSSRETWTPYTFTVGRW